VDVAENKKPGQVQKSEKKLAQVAAKAENAAPIAHASPIASPSSSVFTTCRTCLWPRLVGDQLWLWPLLLFFSSQSGNMRIKAASAETQRE